VRGHLYAVHWRVCAYCGRHLPGNDRGDVEHYRPKAKVLEAPNHGGYWWLAYNLANYLLSCRVCNGRRKRNRFPLAHRAQHVTFANQSRLLTESRLLFHPAEDPLDSWLRIDFEKATLVPVTAAINLSRIMQRRVNRSIEFFRLNRDPHLLHERRVVLDQVTQALDTNRDDIARALAVRYSPQSAVAYAVLRERASHLLPDHQFEQHWLLNQISHTLELITCIRERYPEDEPSRVELEETLWTLATLWHNTPDPKTQLSDWCKSHGVLDLVKRRANQLG
jgi:hypothetical protein